MDRGSIARKRCWMLELAGWGRDTFQADELLGRVPDTKRRRGYLATIPASFTATDRSMVYQQRDTGRWFVLVGRTPLTRRVPGASEYAAPVTCSYASKASALAAARRAEAR